MREEEMGNRCDGVCVCRVLLGAIVALAAALVILPGVALASGDADQASCPSSTETSPGFRTYLPDCRAYEHVTPSYKEGGILLPEPAAIATDGEHVIVGVGGAFAGAGNLRESNHNADIGAYELNRTDEGWVPTALMPSATEYPDSAFMEASPADELATTLWGASRTNRGFTESIYLRTPEGRFVEVGPGIAPEIEQANEEAEPRTELSFAGASADLVHQLFSLEAQQNPKGHSDLWPGDGTRVGNRSLYEYDYRDAASAEPTLVGVDSAGTQISECGTELGGGSSASAYNAVSSDGSVVYFTAKAGGCSAPNTHGEHGGAEGAGPAVNEIYARVDGNETVAVSEPALPGGEAGECGAGEPCESAEPAEGIFEGASEDGSRVFFLSEQPLVSDAPAAGMKLYEERLGGGRVVEVRDVSNPSADAGLDPEVQGLSRVAESGERVYFVAKGKLTGTDTVSGRSPEMAEPVEGADNLYVYDAKTQSLTFVATLLREAEETTLRAEEDEEGERVSSLAEGRALRAFEEAESHGESSGEAFDAFFATDELEKERLSGSLGPAGTLAEDTEVWSQDDSRPVQATPSGASVVFPASAHLTAGDESRVPQLFEYDAESETLVRVSVGRESGGNVQVFREAPHIPARQFSELDRPAASTFGAALSENGSAVLFTNAAALVPAVREGSVNAYMYEGGNVYLISDGQDASTDGSRGEPSVSLYGMAGSGRDVFFTTADSLVPQDGESQVSLYDAREDGGFPAPALEPGCLGETCRVTTGVTPQLSGSLSAGQTPGGNIAPLGKQKTTKPKRLTRKQKLRRALKVCARKPTRKRAACERRARRRFGGGAKASRYRGDERGTRGLRGNGAKHARRRGKRRGM